MEIADETRKFNLESLLDIRKLSALLESLNRIDSFTSALIDNNGKILIAVGWQEICTDFHRADTSCEKDCLKSDRYILEHLEEAKPYVSYTCKRGLIDNAFPIIINGMHLGYFFVGQFLLDKPDEEFFRSQAHEFGFDEENYISALRKVPIWSKGKLDNYVSFIKEFLDLLVTDALQKLHENEINEKVNAGERKYRKIIESTKDGFWIVDNNGCLIEANNAYSEMSGYTLSELSGMQISQLDIVDNEEIVWQRTQKIIQNGSDIFETIHRKKDGSSFNVEISVNYIPENDGNFYVFIRDITEKIISRKEITASETKFRKLFEDALTGDFFTDKDGYITDCNHSFLNIFEFESKEEVLGVLITDLYPNKSERGNIYTRLIKEKKIENYEAFRSTKNGKIKYIIENIIGEFDDKGNLTGTKGYMYDISIKKEYEDSLKAAEENYRSLFELSPSGILIHKDGKILMANHRAKELLCGRSCSDLVGMEILSFVDRTYKEIVSKRVAAIVQNLGSVPLVEEILVRADGTKFYAEVVAQAVQINGEAAVQVLFNDISERKKYENVIIESRKKAEESDKLKTSFLQNMSHEIRTPLNGIMGFTKLLKKTPDVTGEEFEEFTDLIISSSDRLLAIVNDVLEISRLDSGLVKLNISEFVLKELVIYFKNLYQDKIYAKGLSFTLSVTDDIKDLKIKTDKDKLYQIISNLLNNAAKFTEHGGIEFGIIEKNNGLKIFIKDTGIGIKPEFIDKIYDRFWQYEAYSNTRYGGTGLGLSISKGLADILGIQLTVRSVYGEGTEFELILTDHLIPGLSQFESESDTGMSLIFADNNLRILIVEDEPINFILLKKVLQNSNVKVDWAQNGVQAVEKIFNSNYEIILMDLKMPIMDGFEASRRIKQIRPDIKIIAQTAYTHQEEKGRALESGCDYFISKPIDMDKLLKLVYYLVAN